jgi:hypothetical protein
MAADCDTDHCLLVAKVRERLAVNKQRLRRFHVERFNLMTLNVVEGKGERCSKLLYERKQVSRCFRNKERENLSGNINEHVMNSENKNISDLYREVNEFKRGFQPSNILVKDDNVNLLADSHSILNRLKNYSYFSQLLNVHNVSDVRQIEVHTAEPLLPGPSRLEVEIAIAKLKKNTSPGSDQIPAELIQTGGEILLSAIHKLINSVCNKE